MSIQDVQLAKILLDEGYVERSDIDRARQVVKETGVRYWDFLLQQDIITKDLLGQALAEHYKLSYANINSHPPDSRCVLILPEEFARRFHVVCLGEHEGVMYVATDNSEQPELHTELGKIFTGKKSNYCMRWRKISKWC